MRTLRRGKPDARPDSKQEPKQAPPIISTPEAPKPEAVAAEPELPQGFRVAVTPEGDVDLDRMSPKSIEKLRIAVNSPAVQKNILKAPAAEPEKKREPVLPEALVAKMYDAVGLVEVAVSTRFFGVDAGVAERVLPFNEKEKNLLVPATAAVIDKHSGEWLRTHKEETLLITMLVLTFTAKIVQLRLQLHLLEEQKKTAKTPAPPAAPPQPATAPTEGESANGAAA